MTRVEFKNFRSRIESDERARNAKAELTLVPPLAAGHAKMKTKIDKDKGDAAAQVAKAKRVTRACEVAIRQEATRATTADEQAGRTVETEQTERRVERLLRRSDSPSTVLALIERVA